MVNAVAAYQNIVQYYGGSSHPHNDMQLSLFQTPVDIGSVFKVRASESLVYLEDGAGQEAVL